MRARLLLFLGVSLALFSSACRDAHSAPAGAAIAKYGCGSCHTIPGISGANGKVGPSLAGIGDRRYIAGQLSNSPGNMMLWIQHPLAVNPKTVMPELGVTPEDAKVISAFLYTLK